MDHHELLAWLIEETFAALLLFVALSDENPEVSEFG